MSDGCNGFKPASGGEARPILPGRGLSRSHSSAGLSGFGVVVGVLFVLSTRVCLWPVRGVTFVARKAETGEEKSCATVVAVP